MKIGIIGAGAFGTSLGNLFAKHLGAEVLIYAKKIEIAEEINAEHSNASYFPEVKLSKNLKATNSAEKLFDFAELIFAALPSHALENFLLKNHAFVNQEKHFLIICTKGISKSGEFFDDLILEIFDDKTKNCEFQNFAFMLGPSFANELILDEQTFVNLLSGNEKKCLEIIEFFQKSSITNEKKLPINFFYHESLKAGQIFAMMKNICAIYIGILRGAEVSDDFCAAFFTFFLSEIKIFLEKMNLSTDIVFSFAGIGDLFLTCTSKKSRNFCFGFEIGLGFSKNHHQDFHGLNFEKIKLPEGYYALENLFNNFSKKHNFVHSDLKFSKKLFNFLLKKEGISFQELITF